MANADGSRRATSESPSRVVARASNGVSGGWSG
jgi:hypothetical protein